MSSANKPNRDKFNEIIEPSEVATPPKAFSFSYLKKWKDCPKKVYLEASFYDGMPNRKYPLLFNSRQLEGDLIHKLFEVISEAAKSGTYKSTSEVLANHPLRKILRKQIVELRAKLSSNPRINVSSLISSLDIERIINISKEWIFSEITLNHSKNRMLDKNNIYGSEIVIGIDEPPLMGKLDFVSKGEIIDFKTGEPDDSHISQMTFYALLWKLKFGVLPSKASLLYSRSSKLIEVELSEEKIIELEKSVIEDITEIRSSFEKRHFPARPDIKKCRRCAVRHLCDGYWNQTDTNEVDGTFGDLRILFQKDERIEPTELLKSYPHGFTVFLGPSNMPPKTWQILEARILNVRIDKDAHRAFLLNNSEVFWKHKVI